MELADHPLAVGEDGVLVLDHGVRRKAAVLPASRHGARVGENRIPRREAASN